ncbi:MAG: hypothetical protein ABI679_04895 [Gemmatimonadota bacterium]
MLFRSVMAAAIALTLIGCGADRSAPTAPATSDRAVSASLVIEEERVARLARELAMAMNNPAFRGRLRDRLEASPEHEQKIHFQPWLVASNRKVLEDIARESGTSEEAIQVDAASTISLELYFPVASHRSGWMGGANFLVATALHDGDAPVAFDGRGRRFLLDPDHPPDTPVLALVPVESDFSDIGSPRPAVCTPGTCPPSGGGGGGGGSGGPGGSPPAPGIYMSYAHVAQSFESWLKGDPEFEVHVLGQSGQSDSLKSYQCAGEHAGGPYAYDQNGTDWSGSVLLFSQAQLDSYKAQHPGQSIRIFLVEDDDTACDIRSGSGTFEGILAVVDAAYNAFTGGRDSTLGPSGRFLVKARSFQKLLQKIAGVIKTNDEMVGNAIEDSVVGQYYGGANWIVKGEYGTTTGWIKLIMK